MRSRSALRHRLHPRRQRHRCSTGSAFPKTPKFSSLPPDVFASAVAHRITRRASPRSSSRRALHSDAGLARPATARSSSLAGLQDPGNLGTLIRSAEAFGATGVLTAPRHRQPLEPESPARLRRLRLPRARLIAATDSRSASQLLAQRQHPDPRRRRRAMAIPQRSTTSASPCALIIGNEGSGLQRTSRRADAPHHHPHARPGRIAQRRHRRQLLLYEAARQRGETA